MNDGKVVLVYTTPFCKKFGIILFYLFINKNSDTKEKFSFGIPSDATFKQMQR